jgi:hypothetical protein
MIPETLPNNWWEVLLLPGFFSVFGVIIWIAGHQNEVKAGRRSPWKWIALIPFGIALYTGLQWTWPMFAPGAHAAFYRTGIEPYGTKMRVAHYSAFFFPVLIIFALGIWMVIERKLIERGERY